ncbi:MAG: transglutaminase-like cysteine peptidase [Sphingomonadales bacterium]|nr:transglutaminase-like cysteine peptidase [Sphingomonadales bacterium]
MRRILITSLIASVGLLATAASAETLFGTGEIRSTRLDSFRKWRDMLDRDIAENVVHERRSGACIPSPAFNCGYAEWEELIARLSETPSLEALQEVNRHINHAPYIVDPINWGVPDYWATLRQFLARDGDCEDYAIAKYVTLKRLGIDARTMRIVVLQDENLGVPHAVLAVEAEGDIWVLDNQIDRVVSHRLIRHYRPIYSINETAWWLHHTTPG